MTGGSLTCAASLQRAVVGGERVRSRCPQSLKVAVLPCHVLFAGAGGPIVINIRKSVTSQFPSGVASQHPMVTAGAHICGYLPIHAI